MTASDLARLKHADFNALSASEFHWSSGWRARSRCRCRMRVRRTRPGTRGTQLHWARSLRQRARTGGELLVLRRLQRAAQPLPLLVLVDVSGSMERYARLLLAFLHAATARTGGATCSPSAPT
jgi:uncharacterized protein with von Willebrand factor type A (vWA) domain